MDATDMGSDLQQVLITEEQIGQRLDEMAAQIDADYAGRDPLLVGVLKGGWSTSWRTCRAGCT